MTIAEVRRLEVDVRRVDAVLFTHAHGDHILGVDDLKGFNFAQQARIPLHGTAPTLEHVRELFRYNFDPSPDYQGGSLAQLDLTYFEAGSPFTAANIAVTPIPLWHGRMAVTGYRVGNMAYLTDCNKIPDESFALLKDLGVLFIDGLRYEPHLTHFTIPEAIATAQKIGARQTYILHMTHTIDYDEVSAKLPATIALAYDGLTVDFEG